MWKNYHMPETIEQVLIAERGKPSNENHGRGTDLMVEIREHKWPNLEDVIDISRVHDLDKIYQGEDGWSTSRQALRITTF